VKKDFGDVRCPEKLLEKEDATPSMFINDISKLFKQRVSSETERAGISDGCRKMLMFLAHEDGVSQLQIVKHTRLSAPTVSVALAKMEADGLVIRKADEHDMRQVKVFITESGRETDEFMHSKCAETESVMLDGITEEELGALNSTLRKILKNLLESEDTK
jgi:DNA-binding MarR family transcriptional regulator